MTYRNIVSVAWGDHVMFGEGDGRLATPGAVRRRVERWRDDLGAGVLHWRMVRPGRVAGHLHAAKGHEHPFVTNFRDLHWDDFEIVPRAAHDLGLGAYLYVSLLDEGWPLRAKRAREKSYHNAWHARHVSWQSAFTREHPEVLVVDRDGRRRQMGVPCLAYAEVRAHFRKLFLNLIEGTAFDGLFVCLRSQSRPADFADQYGFNEPIRRDYMSMYGHDIRRGAFDVQAWRDLLGGYLTLFLGELRDALGAAGKRLAVGAARGDVLGPPLGNATLQWRQWIERDIVDELIINQNSSRCPSTWIDLWPMHRGTGYLQSDLDGANMPPLIDHVADTCAPVFPGRGARLFVARQWESRDDGEETALLANPAVSGLVFSSFRFDNPGPVARGDWRA